MAIEKPDIRPTNKTAHFQPGWIVIEMMVALGIFTILLVAFTQTQGQLQRLNAVHWTKTRCIAAAQAQLDSIAARGQPIAEAELQRLWPGISLTIEKSPGQNDWQGLTLVRIIAGAQAEGKYVKVELVRYLISPEEH